jgi:hypothetical protein
MQQRMQADLCSGTALMRIATETAPQPSLLKLPGFWGPVAMAALTHLLRNGCQNVSLMGSVATPLGNAPYQAAVHHALALPTFR